MLKQDFIVDNKITKIVFQNNYFDDDVFKTLARIFNKKIPFLLFIDVRKNTFCRKIEVDQSRFERFNIKIIY